MPNITQMDPTRTTTLRAQYGADMKRRFNKIRTLVLRAVGDLDVLGLSTNEPMAFNNFATNALPERQAYRFQRDDQKITSFNSWFQEQVDQGILEVDVKGNPWTAKYVDSAYRKGSVRAYIDAHADELQDTPDFYRGKRSEFLESSFAHPERMSKLKFLGTRSYEDLKGISAAMSQQISRVLADGISHGKGPRSIARDLYNTVGNISKTRAMTMARTEIIAAHAEGQLDSYEELGIDELEVMVEWSTAGDDRVCSACADLQGTVMKIDEARGLIPRHPNCRCAWIPANVGEKTKAKRFWTKAEKQERLEKSLLDSIPGAKTLEEAKARSTWVGKDLLKLVKPVKPVKGLKDSPILLEPHFKNFEEVLELTLEDFRSKPPKGYKYVDKVLKYEEEHLAWLDTDGKIAVRDAFFGHGSKERREILAHEVAHGIEDLVSPTVKAQLFDNKTVMEYRGRNMNEKLANWFSEVGTLPLEVAKAHPELVERVKLVHTLYKGKAVGKVVPVKSVKSAAVAFDKSPWDLKRWDKAPKLSHEIVSIEEAKEIRQQFAKKGRLNPDGRTVKIYHVTLDDEDVLAKIQKEGLVPGASGPAGQTFAAEHSQYATYFHTDRDIAMRDVIQSEGTVVLIEADIPITPKSLLRIIPDEDASNIFSSIEGRKVLLEGGPVAYIGGVPAKALKIVRKG